MQGLTIGTQVHYILASGPNKGVDRPAIVVDDLSDVADGLVNLQVFSDGTNDFPYSSDTGTIWQTYVSYDGGQTPRNGTWHFPPAPLA